MEIFSLLNYFAILVAALAYFILGSLWYSKMMFVKPWGEANKIDFANVTAESKKMLPMMLVTSFIMMFLVSLGMAIISRNMHIAGWEGGLKLGLLSGVCFAMATTATNYVYLNKPRVLYFIDGGYHLAGFMIVSVILAVWK